MRLIFFVLFLLKHLSRQKCKLLTNKVEKTFTDAMVTARELGDVLEAFLDGEFDVSATTDVVFEFGRVSTKAEKGNRQRILWELLAEKTTEFDDVEGATRRAGQLIVSILQTSNKWSRFVDVVSVTRDDVAAAYLQTEDEEEKDWIATYLWSLVRDQAVFPNIAEGNLVVSKQFEVLVNSLEEWAVTSFRNQEAYTPSAETYAASFALQQSEMIGNNMPVALRRKVLRILDGISAQDAIDSDLVNLLGTVYVSLVVDRRVSEPFPEFMYVDFVIDQAENEDSTEAYSNLWNLPFDDDDPVPGNDDEGYDFLADDIIESVEEYLGQSDDAGPSDILRPPPSFADFQRDLDERQKGKEEVDAPLSVEEIADEVADVFGDKQAILDQVADKMQMDVDTMDDEDPAKVQKEMFLEELARQRRARFEERRARFGL